MKYNEFLQAAIDVQKERGAQYDKPSGERSQGTLSEIEQANRLHIPIYCAEQDVPESKVLSQ